MKVFQIGNGKIYKSETAFRKVVSARGKRSDKDRLRIFELKTETTVEAYMARNDRDQKLEGLLDPTNKTILIKSWAVRKGEEYAAKHTRGWRQNASAELIKSLSWKNEKEIKSTLSNKGELFLNDVCESVEDYKMVLKFHNYRSFKHKRVYNRQISSYEKQSTIMENGEDKENLFLQAKKELKAEAKK